MASLEDIVAATKVLAENSDKLMSGAASDDVLEKEEKGKHGSGSCKDNGGNGDEKFSASGRNCSYAGVNGDEKGYGNGEKSEDCDHGFRVGDFVWGKIKCHPWYPGQIYDPKDASDFAVKHSQEGRLLVAFFGDGSCSWCLPSQLVPFVENFQEMSVDSTSKSSLNAVQRAVNEIGRLLESEMTCKCIPVEMRDGLARPVAANAGVKAGVLVPEVDIHRLSIPQYEAADILAELVRLSRGVCSDSVFEVAVLRSWLCAFYRAKGGYKLPVYLEPLPIEGMEDKNKNVAALADDFSVPIEVPILRPMEDDLTSPTVNHTAKSQPSSDDKIYHRRKQKSVAELMGEKTTVKSKSRKKATLKEEKDARKPTSSLKRKKNNEKEGGGGEPSSLTGKMGKKRQAEVSESPKLEDDDTVLIDAENSGAGAVNCVKKGKPKEIEVDVIANTSGTKEETDEVSTPRERKKSKYLSPPYTNPSWSTIENLSSKKERETNKVTKTDRLGEHTVKASGDHCRSPPVAISVDNASEGELPDNEINGLSSSANNSHPKVKNDSKMTFPVTDVDVPVNELLSEVQFAAVDPLYLSKEGSLDTVWAFVSALRSSTYLRGPDYKIYQKCKRGRKRKSTPTDDVMLDVQVIMRKLEIMTAILENYHSKFSPEEKSSLKDEMKRLMENVETASEKVRVMAEST
ncbi:hypothetical protein Salat_2190600 [Sesamum alatum]|uniref:PWWP domain-containing protein n=1 Tax=Sesamum alatum TaxID=300844 RepID=A0AAE1XUD8_9LAMI|nr:hypothetical protein Salat_2190600 [Sesamum alatum]